MISMAAANHLTPLTGEALRKTKRGDMILIVIDGIVREGQVNDAESYPRESFRVMWTREEGGHWVGAHVVCVGC